MKVASPDDDHGRDEGKEHVHIPAQLFDRREVECAAVFRCVTQRVGELNAIRDVGHKQRQAADHYQRLRYTTATRGRLNT